MSAAPEVITPQNVAEIGRSWKVVHSVRKGPGKGPSSGKLSSGDTSSSSDEPDTKVRKPYTITKQRERWTETEHQKFLEALKLYGRAWRRIEEYIGTKTAVQIRSHAQKFFFKLEREASTGSSAGKLPEIAIPPPRPKRKPNHPYPKKAGSSPPVLEEEHKETSSLSSPQLVGAHSQGFQSGSFNPCTSRGPGSGTGAFIESPLYPGHSFGPEGSVKIFGKTVVVPGTSIQSVLSEASKACLGSKDASSLGMESPVPEPKQVVGFSPFTKVRKSVSSVLEAPQHLGRNGFHSGAIHSEGSDESLGKSPGYGLAEGDNEAVDNGECNVDAASAQKLEGGLSTVGLQESEKLDMQFSHMHNPAVQSWMNFVQYRSSSSIPTIPAKNGVLDGPSSSSLSYWQFMQASAVNYAAYTTVMAAAAAAGWKISNPGGTDVAEFAKSSRSESQFPCLPSPWCPLGVVPSLYFPSPRMFHQGEGLDSCENGKALKNEKMMGVCKDTPPHGQPDTELKEPEISLENSETAQTVDSGADGKTIDLEKAHRSSSTSCLTKTSRNPEAFLDTDSQSNAEAMLVSLKFFTKGSDTEGTAISHLLQNTYSSSDELEEQGKKQGEGSSSGSNTPASRYQPSEYDPPVDLETKKRDSDTLFADNYDREGAQASHHQRVDLPKLRLKNAEKGRKHPQRDARHGGWCEDSKRFKSCAHDLELRKEVSQGGRKAFQALFTSKLLPQTFPSANLVSRPIVSTDESRLSECINSSGIFQGEMKAEADHAAADVETRNEVQGLKGQSMANNKGFTVSSSSGFVPYRRLVSPEPMNLDQCCPL